MNVREVIKEAVTRVNLVPRKQAIPGDLVETSYRLLKGVVSKYNKDNLLSFTQNSVTIDLAQKTHIYDEHNSYEEDPSMQHVNIPRVEKVNSIFLTNDAAVPVNIELSFVPFSQFMSYTNDSRVFTAVEKSQGEWIITIKPIVSGLNNYKMTINYNEGIQLDLDDDLYIPDNYTELLIIALAHKLALQFPRLDDTQMQRLENDLRVMVDNVRTPKAMTKFLKRDNDYCDRSRMSQSELCSGDWLM